MRKVWVTQLVTLAALCVINYFYFMPRFDCLRASFIRTVTRENAVMVVHCWLKKTNPVIYNNCKVIFRGPEEDSDTWGYVRDEGEYIKVMGWVCGRQQIFWVNKRTRRVDRTEIPGECYTSWGPDGKQSQSCPDPVTERFPDGQ
ncbi:MAG: hypothetical protein Q8Q08_01160 [Candidatus Omnitrophota bacterium]|nr:hypothetical protein [Candidatus Omnitrophota bacterium]MDZ4241283.1 hypothetical protein [Candidatus Omnitrophota bacterium]